MKKRITLLMTLAIISLCAFTQEKCKHDYNRFKSYFEQAAIGSKGKQNKIPISLASKVIGNDEIIDEYVKGIEAFDMFKKGESTVFIIELMYPQGGYTASYGILSYSDETLRQAEIIGYNALDIDGGARCELNMINDTLLEVKSEEVEYNESGKEKKTFNTEYNYYVVNNHGFYKVIKGGITKARLYPQVSTRILEIPELEKFGKPELDVMRNEIFAAHGYKFKSEKWQEYFASQSWYNPRFDDVTDKLTIIERINIENILKVAPLK